MEIHVAFFRGINVAGKNKLLMSDCRRLFLQAGCENVSSYIQSGNVIFQATPEVLTSLPAIITSEAEARHSCRTSIVLRSADRMSRIVASNPFPADPPFVFLANDPLFPPDIATLDPTLGLPDQYLVRNQEIYVLYRSGSARSKLNTAYFDRRLHTVTTARNWQTILSVTAACSQAPAGASSLAHTRKRI